MATANTRKRSPVLRTAGTVLVALLAAELFCRFALGLGDPLLLETDPNMEYLYKPNQDVTRFGHRIRINRFAMRGPDASAERGPHERWRVLLLGDSIVFGTSLLGDDETIGARLEAGLSRSICRPGRVLSGAAGSWGPANDLAYAERFGFFDADVVVVLLPTGDWCDRPTFEEIVGRDPEFPAEKPWSALVELFDRYLGRLARWRPPAAKGCGTDYEDGPLRELLSSARKSGATAIFVHWPSRRWSNDPATRDIAGLESFRRAAADAGAGFVDLTTDVGRIPEEASRAALYADGLHPTRVGAEWIARQLEPSLAAHIRELR